MNKHIPNLILGTAQFGLDYGIANNTRKLCVKEIFDILEFAWENGVHSFDTAPCYNSEKILGDFIKVHGVEKEIKILTKISAIKNKNEFKSAVRSNIENSLKNLGSRISVLFLHDPKDSTYLIENVSFFKRIVKEYSIKSLGVSVYTPDEVKKTNKSSFDLAYQFPLNILDRRFSRVIMPNGKRYARSIFLQGVLASKNSLRKGSSRKLKDIYEKYHQYIRSYNIDPIQAAISFIEKNNNVDYFLVGVDNLKQLKKIIFLKLIDVSHLISHLPFQKKSRLYDPRNW